MPKLFSHGDTEVIRRDRWPDQLSGRGQRATSISKSTRFRTNRRAARRASDRMSTDDMSKCRVRQVRQPIDKTVDSSHSLTRARRVADRAARACDTRSYRDEG